ncbi:MAG: BLUF domain-containing protein [Kangiellaceae bacterium]|jgi:hypothetical protein|nr:BLUF domain-containing protein [Kangiellaceae bacterium]
MSIISLTYSSRYTGPKYQLIIDLQSIFDTSIVNNITHNISGVLLYCNNHFLQTIEGNRPNVEKLFEKISHDSRHSDITTLLSHAIERRMYPEWNMQPINIDNIRLFNNDNLLQLKSFLTRTLQLDAPTYHQHLNLLLDDPNVSRLLVA